MKIIRNEKMVANTIAISTIDHETFLYFLNISSISLVASRHVKLHQRLSGRLKKDIRQEGQAYQGRDLFPKMRVKKLHV
jgi:hypothetical protein